MSKGAFYTGEYPNFFERIGISRAEADKRVADCFQTIFFDETEKFYLDVDEDSGCMVDTGNNDARTEGMSYGMMMCVQMDNRALFDKLWCFSKRYMCQPGGKCEGYFAWSVSLEGKHNAEGPASDGEEYYALALFMAAARWGNGQGIYNYTAQARTILRHCLHQHEMVQDGQTMWDLDNYYIKFVPSTPFTDPSYHLPHFYELFALKADECDRAFWKKAAAASRAYLPLAAHPVTGLSPEYAAYDGTMMLLFGKVFEYYSDAYRVAMNIALDTLWFGKDEGLARIATNLQNFFTEKTVLGDYYAYHLDGTPFDEAAMHPTAIIATNAAAGIASDAPSADQWLRDFWNTKLRKGERRYYDNCLYFFCLLMLSGNYKIY